MGIFDFMKDAGDRIFGRDDAPERDVTKPLSTHLRENGIDPSGIDFRFEGSGTVIMSGTVKSQDDREKAVLVVGNVQGVERVDDRLRVARADADFSRVSGSAGTTPAAPGAVDTVSRGAAADGDGWTSRTYTVKPGDTLSAIAKAHYGDAGAYTRIFEANQPMLKDPDRIYPGQVLRIPAA